MNVKVAAAVAAFALAVTGARLIAHHSFAAEFDAMKPLEMKGIVTKIEWQNPHTYFYVDVTSADGQVTNWGMEMGSPNGLMRQGWTRNTMKVGDEVAGQGAPAQDRTNIGHPPPALLPATRNAPVPAASPTATPQ